MEKWRGRLLITARVRPSVDRGALSGRHLKCSAAEDVGQPVSSRSALWPRNKKSERVCRAEGPYNFLRGPRIIAVAGNLGDLWGEQHRIETRTKPNHSWVNSGRLTIGGNNSRSPFLVFE